MTDPTRRTRNGDGIDAMLFEAGNGPPLIFLHGACTVTEVDFAATSAKRPWRSASS